MDDMCVPVTDHIGQAVIFTGKVREIGGYARFTGKVATADGKAPVNESAVADMELDFAAQLQKKGAGRLESAGVGFAGDTNVMEGARENHPQAPWPLFEWVECRTPFFAR